MIQRHLTQKLYQLLDEFPAVALLGPRQVGKTTLALDVAKTLDPVYLDLESAADRTKLSEPEIYLSDHKNRLVIIDEIQRVPGLFQELRGLIDRGRRDGKKSGRFLLLGSASIELLRQSSESLAGRIAYLELNPFNLIELPEKQQDSLWIRGGFPDSFLAKNEQQSFRWREHFIRTYLERDIPQLGSRIPAETLRRFWIMLAHIQGGTYNAASLARSLGMDNKTISHYLDLLVDLLLVRRLQPWQKNIGKRLVKSPKIYIRDSGILHALLGLDNKEAILGHPVTGNSWEGFVIESLLNIVPERTEANFYRASGGAEIDLILRLPGKKPWAIEIKRSLSPGISKGFHSACKDINPEMKLVVYPGKERYKTSQNVEVITLPGLIQDIVHPDV